MKQAIYCNGPILTNTNFSLDLRILADADTDYTDIRNIGTDILVSVFNINYQSSPIHHHLLPQTLLPVTGYK